MALLRTYNKDIVKDLELREVFEREDQDFTPWLAENINLLADKLGFDSFTVLETEAKMNQDADKRSIDILAAIDNDTYVVIENQYGCADYGHWGKTALYYLPPLEDQDKKVVHIWIAEEFDQATIKAIDNLNKKHNYCIYLVEATCVGNDISFKLKLNLVLSPDSDLDNSTVKAQIATAKKELSEKDLRNEQVSQQLADNVVGKDTKRLHYGHQGVHTKVKSKQCPDCFVDVSFSPQKNQIRIQATTDLSPDVTRETKPGVMEYFTKLANTLSDARNNLSDNQKNAYVEYAVAVKDVYNITNEEFEEIKIAYNKLRNEIK